MAEEGAGPPLRSLQTRTENGGGERVKNKNKTQQQSTLLNEGEWLMHNTESADAAAGTGDQMTGERGLS